MRGHINSSTTMLVFQNLLLPRPVFFRSLSHCELTLEILNHPLRTLFVLFSTGRSVFFFVFLSLLRPRSDSVRSFTVPILFPKWLRPSTSSSNFLNLPLFLMVYGQTSFHSNDEINYSLNVCPPIVSL